jgi:hypothetical protein
MAETAGVQKWIDEVAERERAVKAREDAQAAEEAKARDEEGQAVQLRFCARHPEFLRNEANGELLRDTYLEVWEAQHPGVEPVWDDLILEEAFSDLLAEGRFTVEGEVE